MGLLQNYTTLAQIPATQRGGIFSTHRSGFERLERAKNKYVGDASIDPKAATPNGYLPPYTWTLPKSSGGLSAYVGIDGDGDVTGANLAGGLNAESTINGVGGFASAPGLELVMYAVATLSGVGAFQSNPVLAGKLEAAASLAGSGSVAAALGAICDCVASILGTGSVAGTPYATAELSADIYVNSGTATTRELAAEVWNSIATEFDEAGTMGEKLSAAGTAGDPWTADVSGYASGTAGAKLRNLDFPISIIHSK